MPRYAPPRFGVNPSIPVNAGTLRELAMPDILARMTRSTDEDRSPFRRTLVRVMAVQLASILLLWLLQATFTH